MWEMIGPPENMCKEQYVDLSRVSGSLAHFSIQITNKVPWESGAMGKGTCKDPGHRPLLTAVGQEQADFRVQTTWKISCTGFPAVAGNRSLQ